MSIVLIIIGLLVAGVTGGASLIESARVRALVNEVNSHKQGVMAFRVARGRLPSDTNNLGYIGEGSGQIYDDSSFGGKYVSSNTAYGVPDLYLAPFVDMYLEGIWDYEPKKAVAATGALTRDNADKSYMLKSFPGCLIVFGLESASGDSDSYDYQLKFRQGMWLYCRPDGLSAKIMKRLDTIMDDGKHNSGNFRGICSGSSGSFGGKISYESAESNNYKCYQAFINLN